MTKVCLGSFRARCRAYILALCLRSSSWVLMTISVQMTGADLGKGVYKLTFKAIKSHPIFGITVKVSPTEHICGR